MKISFVVPTRNSERTLGACLASLAQQDYDDVEILVVDNGSKDSTRSIAAGFPCQVLQGGVERSTQRNMGAEASHGDVLVFIDSDMVLSPRVASELGDLFSADPAVAGALIPELASGKGFWARCRSIEKESYLGDANVEAARAFRRAIFEEVGGYDASLTGPEDWDLADRIRRRGLTIGRIVAPVYHDESAATLRRAFQKKQYYARSLKTFLARPETSRKTGRLFRLSLLRSLRYLHRDPVHVLGLILLKIVEATGFVWGIALGKRRGTDPGAYRSAHPAETKGVDL